MPFEALRYCERSAARARYHWATKIHGVYDTISGALAKMDADSVSHVVVYAFRSSRQD